MYIKFKESVLINKKNVNSIDTTEDKIELEMKETEIVITDDAYTVRVPFSNISFIRDEKVQKVADISQNLVDNDSLLKLAQAEQHIEVKEEVKTQKSVRKNKKQ